MTFSSIKITLLKRIRFLETNLSNRVNKFLVRFNFSVKLDLYYYLLYTLKAATKYGVKVCGLTVLLLSFLT